MCQGFEIAGSFCVAPIFLDELTDVLAANPTERHAGSKIDHIRRLALAPQAFHSFVSLPKRCQREKHRVKNKWQCTQGSKVTLWSKSEFMQCPAPVSAKGHSKTMQLGKNRFDRQRAISATEVLSVRRQEDASGIK